MKFLRLARVILVLTLKVLERTSEFLTLATLLALAIEALQERLLWRFKLREFSEDLAYDDGKQCKHLHFLKLIIKSLLLRPISNLI